MNFLLALELAFAAAAGWTALCRRGDVWMAAAFGAAASAVLFFCHLFGALLFLLLVGADELARLLSLARAGRLTAGQAMRSAGWLCVTAGPALALYLASPLAAGAAAPASIAGIPYKLWALLTPFMTTRVDLTLLTAAAVAMVIGMSWRRQALAPGMAIVFLALAEAWLVAPSEIKGGTFVDVRSCGSLKGDAFIMNSQPGRCCLDFGCGHW
ncbi:MAG: hypothetical protein H7312_14160 [Tardiphaga sp.]|nr:hypothetical protein [Tardiphaga sp.]